jgi:hypothetical protein
VPVTAVLGFNEPNEAGQAKRETLMVGNSLIFVAAIIPQSSTGTI